MVFDLSGNLIIADEDGPRILEVSSDGSRVRTIVSGSNSSEAPSISSVFSVAPADHPKDHTNPFDRHRIIGGEEVIPGEWPFVVRVDAPTSFCTGSLVAPNWILTAAHCLIDDDGQVDDASGHFRVPGVRLGTRVFVRTRERPSDG